MRKRSKWTKKNVIYNSERNERNDKKQKKQANIKAATNIDKLICTQFDKHMINETILQQQQQK